MINDSHKSIIENVHFISKKGNLTSLHSTILNWINVSNVMAVCNATNVIKAPVSHISSQNAHKNTLQ